MQKSFTFIQKIDEESCWFNGMITINPKISYCPDWFLNVMVKRVFYIMIGRMSKKEFFETDSNKLSLEEKKSFWSKVKTRLRELDQPEEQNDDKSEDSQ